ncbi:MAG: inositol transport system substrate-binding protein [Clostridium sp.]|jgi:inositol transport system substrate-binding protein
MKKVKRLMGISMALVLSFSLLAGCGAKSSSETKQKVIGVAIADFSDQFQVYVMNGMKETAAKYPDVKVIYVDAKYDGQKQISEVENLITQQVDAIVIFAVDDNTAIVAAKKINEAKIPLIAVNRALPDPSLAVSFIGSENITSGEIEMTELAKQLNGKGNIVILNGTMGTSPQRDRHTGYTNILKNFPDIKIIAENTADWARDKGMKITEDWLQTGKKIDAVLAENDEMAIGALKAVIDGGFKGKIKVCGIDATPEALDYVKKGELAFTVFQDALGQGQGSIDTAYKVIMKEKVEENIEIPYQLVTKDNVDKFLAK